MSLSCSRRKAVEESEGIEVGHAAPAFHLKDLHGKDISLEQQRGKIVMLDFWATWCGPCRMSMPLLEKLKSRYPNDISLLAINMQEPSDVVRSYITEQHVTSTVLLDEQGEVGSAYRAESIPMQVLIDRQGIVRHVQVGFNPRMEDTLGHEIEKLR